MDIRSRFSSASESASDARARAEADARARRERERDVREAERESQDQIDAARRHADDESREIERRAERERDRAGARIESESEHSGRQLDQVRTEGYKRLHDLKRRQEAELALQQKEGETTQQDLSTARAAEEQLQAKRDERRGAAEQKYTEQFRQVLGDQERSIERLNTRAGRALDRLRQEGAERISAYDSRSEDPFYRMVNLDAELRDTGEAFELRARVPEHEQENVRASVRGNQIVLTGTRRSQDDVRLDEGRARSTASYQTFRESFPIDWPVDPGSMTRESRGDEMVFTFAKRTGMVDPESGAKKTLEHALYSRQHAATPPPAEGLVTPAPPYRGKPIS